MRKGKNLFSQWYYICEQTCRVTYTTKYALIKPVESQTHSHKNKRIKSNDCTPINAIVYRYLLCACNKQENQTTPCVIKSSVE